MASSFLRFLDHAQRHNTVGRTPLDEWSARRRDLYLTTHNTHNRQTSMPPVRFETTISKGERPQTNALDRAATGIGDYFFLVRQNIQLALLLLLLTTRSHITYTKTASEIASTVWQYYHTEDGWSRFASLHYNCARRMTQICVFNKRLFSLHNTLNYAIHRACLWMVLLTDVYRNLTSLWINL